MSVSGDITDSTSCSLCDNDSTMDDDSSHHDSCPECDNLNQGTKNSGLDTLRRKTAAEHRNHSKLQERLQCCRLRCGWMLQKLEDNPWCPSCRRITRIIALLALGLMLWGNAYSLLGNMAGLDGQLFRMGVLFVTAHFAGWLVHFTGLPPLLGMLLTGIFLRNIGFVVLTGKYLALAGNLRNVALVVILIRAGLGLDPAALKRLSWMVIKLSIFPSVIEAVAVAVMTHFFLNFPWLWGLLLGAVLAAVSPAVVIPCSVNLQDKGYGTKKGIPTLIIAAASIDDINAISAFGVILGIIFSTGNQTSQLLQGPLGLGIGLLCGIAMGLFLRCVPQKHDEYAVTLRTLLLAIGSLLLMFGIDALGYKGAGPLGCIVAAFVACNGWRSDQCRDCKNPVGENFVILWTIFQPVLFGLIGTEINLFVLEGRIVALGLLCLGIPLLARMVSSALTVTGGNFNLKEKIFVALAWFPKATVQAAIGPVALDMARRLHMAEEEALASEVLMIAVLGILITAPIGAIFITVLGPKLLCRENKHDTEDPAAVEELITNT